MYAWSTAKPSHDLVSAASAEQSDNLLMKYLGYMRFLQASARVAQMDRDDRLIWSVRAYRSSGGHSFDRSKVSRAAKNASLYTRNSRKLRTMASDAGRRGSSLPSNPHTKMLMCNTKKLFGGRSMTCDFAGLGQNRFCTRPVAPLQGSFGLRSCPSPAVSRRNTHPPNSF
jgi:hypothetical protein